MTRRAVLDAVVPSPDERRRAIEAESLPSSVGALLEEAAREAKDRLVWHFFESGEKATYAELNARVNALARGFLGIGVTKGSHVAVMLPNIAAMPTTWLALARLGAVMVPINTNYRERELAYVVNNSDACFLVVHELCLPLVEKCISLRSVELPSQNLIVVGRAVPGRYRRWEDLALGGGERFETPNQVGPNDLLNIQYTSGTTGFPKGCMLTHRYWVTSGKLNAFRDGRRYRRILASTPFFYMDPQWLLLMTLYQRATLYVAARQSTSRFMEWVREHRIDFCLLPWVICKQPDHPSDAHNEVVRANVYGVARHLHAEIEARFDLCAREAFGMTEVGPAMYMPIEAVDMVGSGSCGIPCPFRECRVVDEDGRPLPAGEIGELVIRGSGIMRGYYNNPDATAAAFHGEWFRTGDLFRMDEQGYFYIVGRLKDVIRRSAENIAAREVESVLNAIPEVAEAAVVPVPDELRGEEIKAYLSLRNGTTPSDALLGRIIQFCGHELAPFKVPRFFAFRSEFPRTPSLKIAKPALIAEASDLRWGSFDRVSGQWL